MRDAFALGDGPYHFFDRSSRSAAASNICSAKSFFSLAFSSSSCFNRVASETPCLRARSAVFAPASCSFNTPMICSSVNRARFICPSLFQGRTLNPRGGKSQWQVNLSERVVCFVEDGNSRLAQGRAARQGNQDDRHSVAG